MYVVPLDAASAHGQHVLRHSCILRDIAVKSPNVLTHCQICSREIYDCTLLSADTQQVPQYKDSSPEHVAMLQDEQAAEQQHAQYYSR